MSSLEVPLDPPAVPVKLGRPRRITSFAFCNPLDREAVVREFKAKGLRGALWVSEYVPKGQPALMQEDFDRSIKPSKVVKDRFLAWYADVYNAPQAANEIRLPMPHATQKTLIYSPRRFKVMVCGRRYGKTTAALIKAILVATSGKNKLIYYVAPTYKQAKQIAWGMLLEYVGQAYSRKNEQELYIEFANGSRIYLKGTENPDSLRGPGIDFAILDEYQDTRPYVWDRVIRPMLADRKGGAWFIGTPKGFNHFHQLFTEALSGSKGPDWQAFRLTSFDNPHLDRAEIESAKSESDPRSFAQEYLAEFVQFEGLVYSDFRRDIHVKAFEVDKISGVDLAGLDMGADHPTAGIFARITSGNSVYVWAEHYRADASIKEHAEDLKALKGKRPVRRWYIDPSAKQAAKDFKTNGIPCTPAVNDRQYGISELRALLRDHKIWIHPNCSNLIFEFEHHRYKREGEKSEGDVNTTVRKLDDDALDALRYLIASHFKGKTHADEARDPPRDPPATANLAFDLVDLDNNGHLGYNNSNPDSPVAPEFQSLSA